MKIILLICAASLFALPAGDGFDPHGWADVEFNETLTGDGSW